MISSAEATVAGARPALAQSWRCFLPVVILSSALACSSSQFASPGAITVAVQFSPNNLDPRVGSDEASQRIHQLVFGSLATFDRELRVVPELATDWETPDDRTYLIHLRRGVRFHDGAELTSADVVYTYRSFLDPTFSSPRSGAYRVIESVGALDPYTVEFRLKEPFGSFPVNLVMGIVRDGATNVSAQPIGTGPYRFRELRQDSYVMLDRFDEYFGEPARNPQLLLKVVPDDTMRGLELRKGTVDVVVNDLAPDIVHELERYPELRTAKEPGTEYAYIGLNLRDPVLADVRVRRALAHAIDRSAIVNYLRRGLATTAQGIVPPTSWAFEPDVAAFPYDPAKARALLDSAGFPDPDGDGPAIRFSLSLKISTAEFPRLQAAVIQEQLRAVGVDINVRSQEFATLYADVLQGRVQLFSLQWVGVTDPDMLRRVFHSQQVPPIGFNRGFFQNATVDRLIDEATRTVDETARRHFYGEAQRVIAEELPYISLWYRTNVAVYQAGLDGVSVSPTASFAFLKDVARASD